MIKTTAMFSVHAIHRILRITLIVFIILSIAFFSWLFMGIKVNALQVGDYSIGGLYIKLDKKLTLKADKITLPQRKAKPSFENVDETFDKIKYLFTFFESIDLRNIRFENNTFDFMFMDEVLYITSNDYEIAGNVHRRGETLEADISMLYIKKEDVNINGKLIYDLNDESLKTEGNFNAYKAKGRFSANLLDEILTFNLESDTFFSLHPIREFELNEGIESWILEKVEAEEYKLFSLSGEGKIDQGTVVPDFDTLKGKMLFSGVKIHFHEDLSPVLVSSFIMTYKDGELYFDLKDPSYEGLDLKGSEVSIHNLLNEQTNVKIKIRTDTGFDSRLKKLLNAYNVVLPIGEKSAKVNVVFMADIGLQNSYKDFFAGINFSQGDIWLQKLKLPIEKGNLQYRDGMITLNNIVLKDEKLDSKVNGKIDLEKKKADLNVALKNLHIGSKKETSLILHNKTFDVKLKYAKNIELTIPKLSLEIHDDDKNITTIHINDLKKIKEYLPKTGLLNEGGSIDIKTKDFETYTFKGVLNRSFNFFYRKEGEHKHEIPFEGKLTPKDLDIFAFQKRFYYNKAKSRLKLKNLHIDFEKFLLNEKQTSKSKNTGNDRLTILGTNSHLKYGNYRLMLDSYDIEVQANGDIKAIGSASGDIIKFSKKKNIINVQALRIKDKILHPLINFKGLYNGRYSLKTSGNPEKTMKGEVIVEGGVMKNFKAYNNTLAFVNTLPALAALHKPGFSDDGFTIKEGVLEYRRIGKDKFIFDSVYINGTDATIVGKGALDLKANTINMNLAIKVGRELGNVVGNLPVLGYILMGKNKSITVGLKITGSLDKPKVTTSGAKDMLLLPLDILKRTLESPAHILNN